MNPFGDGPGGSPPKVAEARRPARRVRQTLRHAQALSGSAWLPRSRGPSPGRPSSAANLLRMSAAIGGKSGSHPDELYSPERTAEWGGSISGTQLPLHPEEAMERTGGAPPGEPPPKS